MIRLFRRQPKQQIDPLEELQERTRQRQQAACEKLIAEGRHLWTGYTPPKDTDLQRRFLAAQAQLQRLQHD